MRKVAEAFFDEQDRITEIPYRLERIAAVTKDYADRPQNVITVVPDHETEPPSVDEFLKLQRFVGNVDLVQAVSRRLSQRRNAR